MKNKINQKGGSSKKNLIFVSLFLLVVIIVPMIIDYFYGKGWLGFFPNSFSAETWFAFVGSYFPAMIMGGITFFQAYIIREKDKQYHELIEQHRFSSLGQAKVYRYSNDTKGFGQYDRDAIDDLWWKYHKHKLSDEWKKGFLLEFKFYDSVRTGIKLRSFLKFEWEIAGQRHCLSEDNSVAFRWRCDKSELYSVLFFCVFQKNSNVCDEVEHCMLYNSTLDQKYMFSDITLILQAEDRNGERYKLNIHFPMEAQDDYQMSSKMEFFSWSKGEK